MTEPAKPDTMPRSTVAGVRALYAEFVKGIPHEAARSGEFAAQPGDRFERLTVDVPNGLYRLHGADWLITVRAGRLVAAVLATAKNKFGGPRVIVVPAEDALERKEDNHGEAA